MGLTLEQLTECGVIAVIRAASSDDLGEVARALCRGGVTAIEVTMTTPNALEVIAALSHDLAGAAMIGVGTVLDAETARTAILAGAEYVISPTLSAETIRMTRRYGKLPIPGAFTPTEVLCAWEAGAAAVKIFPTSTVGAAYIRELHAPLPQIPLIPTGGVTAETAGDFIHAGAVAVGAGAALLPKAIVEARDFDAVAENASRLVAAVQQARRK